jgi:hypothetical protein
MDKKSYFECKRCFHKFNQKTDIIRHFNKKILCTRILESYNYNDDDILNLSLNREYNKEFLINNKYYNCKNCNKYFNNSKSLKRHNNITCKKADKIKNKYKFDDIDNITIINSDNSINNDNITINDNSINDNSITNNSVNLNINIINSFDGLWNTTHIDDNKKLLLLLNNSKFTSTLENILENDENLNVLIDTTSDNALVYNDKKIINMNIKDIVKKTMKKLLLQLTNFKDDIIDPNKYNIDKTIIDEQIKIAENKYTDFRKNEDIQKSVKTFIKDIYNKKKNDTIINYNLIEKNGY